MARFEIVLTDMFPKSPNRVYRVDVTNSVGIIGSFSKVNEGYLVNGNRKPVATKHEAVHQIVSRKMRELKRDIGILDDVGRRISSFVKEEDVG